MDHDDWEERERQIEAGYADYLPFLKAEAAKQNVCGPHCDHYVLHAPTKCQYCDDFPVLQEMRRRFNIAFTGHAPVYGQRPCPAEVRRSVDRIHRWGGNRPSPAGQEADDISLW